MTEEKPSEGRRILPVLSLLALTLATVGFVTGIREPAPRPTLAKPQPVASTAPLAPTYSQIPNIDFGPNAKWHQSIFTLQYEKPGLFDPVVRTEAMKLAALADRAKNRAYDGAPPTVPHPIESTSAASCLVCYGEGLKVADRVATKISHAHMTNCTQCHIEGGGPPSSMDNNFVGLYRAGPGTRASPGAPPTIPHHTWMREDCMSCHGLITRPGTRTTHPWLSECRQCHAESSTRDQIEFVGGRR